jgi:hypothetical protein
LSGTIREMLFHDITNQIFLKLCGAVLVFFSSVMFLAMFFREEAHLK